MITDEGTSETSDHRWRNKNCKVNNLIQILYKIEEIRISIVTKTEEKYLQFPNT